MSNRCPDHYGQARKRPPEEVRELLLLRLKPVRPTGYGRADGYRSAALKEPALASALREIELASGAEVAPAP
jgi:hypothetical protein